MNKKNDINLENEEVLAEDEDFDIVEAVTGKKKKAKKDKKPKKEKLIRNQAFFKRGGYSLAITSIVIIGAIVINVLFGVLAKRVTLEYDMSADKKNTISEENANFIKGIKKSVNIYVCADLENYIGGGMEQYAYQLGYYDGSEYYKQTAKLIERYENLNSNINVKFIDPDTTEYDELQQKYPNNPLYYGDILVTCFLNGTDRSKKLGYTDIYEATYNEELSYYASMYGESYNGSVTGNNIETALASAIAYVTIEEDKRIAVLTGHSSNNYTESYVNFLKQNNYEVDLISEQVITSIPDKYDAVVIAAPTTDFSGDEILALANYLKNDDKLGKGLIYFASAATPYLPNLSDFLTEWGIAVQEGVLWETNDSYHAANEKTSIYTLPTGNDGITNEISYCLTGYNVPFLTVNPQDSRTTITSLMATTEGAIAAPLNVTNEWKDYDKYTPKSYPTVLQADTYDYVDDAEGNSVEVRSYVMAFSSVDFLNPAYYTSNSPVSNKLMAFYGSERAANALDIGIVFETRVIETTNFQAMVTEASVDSLETIFVTVIPLVILAAGIFIYIKRRNA